MNNAALIRPDRRQRGAALLTGLIFMVILTLLGITAARMAGLEERMSGNMRDRSLAMQAAEMALRDAERDIRGPLAGSTRSPAISGISNFVAACTDGLCYNGANGNANAVDWKVTPIWTLVSMTAAPSVAYGANTPATDIDGLSAQPRYLIEGIRKTPPGGAEEFYYRVTVRAQGANPNTVVWLQEVFKP
ncbi:MAG: pilus assembly protein [Gammaproteobacteria bacterium]|nr:pilus assembly protein [Gammaproteobacteria bacterium]